MKISFIGLFFLLTSNILTKSFETNESRKKNVEKLSNGSKSDLFNLKKESDSSDNRSLSSLFNLNSKKVSDSSTNKSLTDLFNLNTKTVSNSSNKSPTDLFNVDTGIDSVFSPKSDMQSFMGSGVLGMLGLSKNSVNFLSNIQHELNEESDSKNKMKMYEFKSSMNSIQNSNDEKPKINGYVSEVELDNNNGQSTIHKKFLPISNEINGDNELRKLTDAFNVMSIPLSNKRLPRKQPVNIVVNDNTDCANNNQISVDTNDNSSPDFDKFDFMNNLLNSNDDQMKNTVDISPDNSIDNIFNLSNPNQLNVAHDNQMNDFNVQIQHKKSMKSKIKKSKTEKLNNFLGNLILNDNVDDSDTLRTNSKRHHIGIQKLLDMIETTERDRLENPINERPQEDSFEKILGKSPHDNPEYLIKQMMGNNDVDESQAANVGDNSIAVPCEGNPLMAMLAGGQMNSNDDQSKNPDINQLMAMLAGGQMNSNDDQSNPNNNPLMAMLAGGQMNSNDDQSNPNINPLMALLAGGKVSSNNNQSDNNNPLMAMLAGGKVASNDDQSNPQDNQLMDMISGRYIDSPDDQSNPKISSLLSFLSQGKVPSTNNQSNPPPFNPIDLLLQNMMTPQPKPPTNTRNHLPHSNNTIYPLMNSFYNMNTPKSNSHPIRYPPLGHTKSTLNKLKNRKKHVKSSVMFPPIESMTDLIPHSDVIHSDCVSDDNSISIGDVGVQIIPDNNIQLHIINQSDDQLSENDFVDPISHVIVDIDNTQEHHDCDETKPSVVLTRRVHHIRHKHHKRHNRYRKHKISKFRLQKLQRMKEKIKLRKQMHDYIEKVVEEEFDCDKNKIKA